MPSKIYRDPAAALDGVLFDGMTIMSGGFGLCAVLRWEIVPPSGLLSSPLA